MACARGRRRRSLDISDVRLCLTALSALVHCYQLIISHNITGQYFSVKPLTEPCPHTNPLVFAGLRHRGSEGEQGPVQGESDHRMRDLLQEVPLPERPQEPLRVSLSAAREEVSGAETGI